MADLTAKNRVKLMAELAQQKTKNTNEIVQTGLSRDERLGENSLAHRQAEAEKNRQNILDIKAGKTSERYIKNTIADSGRIGISETLSGANSKNADVNSSQNQTDFDRAYTVGGLQAVDSQVQQGKLQPTVAQRSGATRYRYGAELTTDERDYYNERINELHKQNQATERRRAEEAKNYNASMARTEASQKTGFADLEQKFEKEKHNENLYLNDVQDFQVENLETLQVKEGDGIEQIDQKLNNIEHQKTDLYQREINLNNQIANDKINYFEKSKERVEKYEKEYTDFFNVKFDLQEENAERKKERSEIEISLQKERILAEREGFETRTGEKRERLEGFLKAKYASYGMLDSSYGLQSISRDIGNFEAQIESVRLKYGDSLRDLEFKQLDILNEYDDAVTKANLDKYKNILDLSSNADEKIEKIEFQQLETESERRKRNLITTKNIVDQIESYALKAKAEEEKALAKAEAKLQEEAEAFSKNTGIIYTVKDEKVVPLMNPQTGEVLRDWSRQKQKAQFLLDFQDIPAQKENFARYIETRKNSIAVAYENGILDKVEFQKELERINELNRDELWALEDAEEAQKRMKEAMKNKGSITFPESTDVKSDGSGGVRFSETNFKRPTGELRAQCGEYVNDMLGFTEENGLKLRNSYESKQKRTTSQTPIIGGFFVQNTGSEYGHTGLVENVYQNSKGEMQMRIAHYNSNNKEEFKREVLTFDENSGKWKGTDGKVRNITGYGEGERSLGVRESENVSEVSKEERNLSPLERFTRDTFNTSSEEDRTENRASTYTFQEKDEEENNYEESENNSFDFSALNTTAQFLKNGFSEAQSEWNSLPENHKIALERIQELKKIKEKLEIEKEKELQKQRENAEYVKRASSRYSQPPTGWGEGEGLFGTNIGASPDIVEKREKERRERERQNAEIERQNAEIERVEKIESSPYLIDKEIKEIEKMLQ